MKNIHCNSAIDQHGVNAILCAIEAELGARAAKRGKKLDAHIMGGGKLSSAGYRDFGEFAAKKNLDLIYVTMDPARPRDTLASSELELTYFATDGVSETLFSTGGRLWMRDRKSQSRLIFEFEKPLEIFAKSNGQFQGRPCVDRRFHDEGFKLAEQSLQRRLETMPPSMPILSSIGSTPVIFDMQTMLRGIAGE